MVSYIGECFEFSSNLPHNEIEGVIISNIIIHKLNVPIPMLPEVDLVLIH